MSVNELFAAIDSGARERVVGLLAVDPSLATTRDAEGVSAVMHALYHGHRDVAEIIAASVPSIDVFEATSLRKVERLHELLVADPSLVAAWSADGFTPLHYAAFFGDGAVAAMLLDAGSGPNVRSRNDFAVMPIHSAVAGKRGDVVRALVEAGADVNVTQRHGWTPLHGAAEHGDHATVELLLRAGADPAAVNDDGKAATDLARTGGHEALVERLEGAAGSGG